MKLRIIIALLTCLALPALAVPVQTTLGINWTLPTTTTTGEPLTGANALTGNEVFIDTAPIPDAPTKAPTMRLAGATTSNSRAVTVEGGDTIYIRVRSCNAAGCSALSAQFERQIAAPLGKPNAPTVTVVVTVVTTP